MTHSPISVGQQEFASGSEPEGVGKNLVGLGLPGARIPERNQATSGLVDSQLRALWSRVFAEGSAGPVFGEAEAALDGGPGSPGLASVESPTPGVSPEIQNQPRPSVLDAAGRAFSSMPSSRIVLSSAGGDSAVGGSARGAASAVKQRLSRNPEIVVDTRQIPHPPQSLPTAGAGKPREKYAAVEADKRISAPEGRSQVLSSLAAPVLQPEPLEAGGSFRTGHLPSPRIVVPTASSVIHGPKMSSPSASFASRLSSRGAAGDVPRLQNHPNPLTSVSSPNDQNIWRGAPVQAGFRNETLVPELVSSELQTPIPVKLSALDSQRSATSKPNSDRGTDGTQVQRQADAAVSMQFPSQTQRIDQSRFQGSGVKDSGLVALPPAQPLTKFPSPAGDRALAVPSFGSMDLTTELSKAAGLPVTLAVSSVSDPGNKLAFEKTVNLPSGDILAPEMASFLSSKSGPSVPAAKTSASGPVLMPTRIPAMASKPMVAPIAPNAVAMNSAGVSGSTRLPNFSSLPVRYPSDVASTWTASDLNLGLRLAPREVGYRTALQPLQAQSSATGKLAEADQTPVFSGSAGADFGVSPKLAGGSERLRTSQAPVSHESHVLPEGETLSSLTEIRKSFPADIPTQFVAKANGGPGSTSEVEGSLRSQVAVSGGRVFNGSPASVRPSWSPLSLESSKQPISAQPVPGSRGLQDNLTSAVPKESESPASPAHFAFQDGDAETGIDSMAPGSTSADSKNGPQASGLVDSAPVSGKVIDGGRMPGATPGVAGGKDIVPGGQRPESRSESGGIGRPASLEETQSRWHEEYLPSRSAPDGTGVVSEVNRSIAETVPSAAIEATKPSNASEAPGSDSQARPIDTGSVRANPSIFDAGHAIGGRPIADQANVDQSSPNRPGTFHPVEGVRLPSPDRSSRSDLPATVLKNNSAIRPRGEPLNSTLPGMALVREAAPLIEGATGKPTERLAGNTVGEEGSQNPFRAMDSSPEWPGPRTAPTPSRELAVGYQDSALGYVELRAHSAAGGIQASLFAESAASEAVISGHIGSLAHFLEARHTPVESVTVSSGGDGWRSSEHLTDSRSGEGGNRGYEGGETSQLERATPAASEPVAGDGGVREEHSREGQPGWGLEWAPARSNGRISLMA